VLSEERGIVSGERRDALVLRCCLTGLRAFCATLVGGGGGAGGLGISGILGADIHMAYCLRLVLRIFLFCSS
jgi:hypothetical protein